MEYPLGFTQNILSRAFAGSNVFYTDFFMRDTITITFPKTDQIETFPERKSTFSASGASVGSFTDEYGHFAVGFRINRNPFTEYANGTGTYEYSENQISWSTHSQRLGKTIPAYSGPISWLYYTAIIAIPNIFNPQRH